MSEILKEYSLKELEDISKNYQLASVQTSTGKKVIGWTPSTKSPDKHFKDCVKRMQLEINPDGFYYFCFAQNRRDAGSNYDKYLFKKGNPKAEILHHPVNTNKNGSDQNILSVQSALDYIQKIADLNAKVLSLEAEVTRLKDENAVMSAELAEIDREEGLSEGKGSDTLTYLKESTPTFLSALDRFFELQDKKINLEQQKINRMQTFKPVQFKKRSEVKTHDLKIGSPEHLELIRKLYNDKNEPALNLELDKLEEQDPDNYNKICVELNLFENDNDDKK